MNATAESQYDQLVYRAKLAGQAGDWQGARAAWVEALQLFPADSLAHRTIQTRIENIDAQLGEHSGESLWKQRLYRLGPAGVVLWKFKTILLLFTTKFSTLFSMLLSLWVYAVAFGWKFALGLIVSIYIHEMGHVVSLRRFGIAATAPMFIPGLGAFIRAKAYPANPGQEARVGLAGPIWGLGAAIIALVLARLTGEPVLYAIARTGAWINLFNLIPVWQLDGGHGFRALTRNQRAVVMTTALIMWLVSGGEIMLLLIAGGCLYRLFTKDYAEEPDGPALWQFAGLIVVLTLLMMLGKAA